MPQQGGVRKGRYPEADSTTGACCRTFRIKSGKRKAESLWVSMLGNCSVVGSPSLELDFGELNLTYTEPADLLSLSALLCVGLVPTGVWVDQFEELHPEQTAVIEFLRKWEQLQRGPQ